MRCSASDRFLSMREPRFEKLAMDEWLLTCSALSEILNFGKLLLLKASKLVHNYQFVFYVLKNIFWKRSFRSLAGKELFVLEEEVLVIKLFMMSL